VTGPAKEVVAAVERFEQAVAQRDFKTICDELFTATARQRAGGDDCVAQTSSAVEGLRRPRLQIEEIRVTDDSAVVRVATEASGQARVTDSLELRKTDGRWLVEAVG
ncbi:MAG: nuclear transport factor 2 family protein, partial [Thermoleophilia bacterium]